MRIFGIIQNEFSAWIRCIIVSWPDSRIGARLRSYYWSHRFNLPKSISIERMSVINGHNKIHVGKNFSFGGYSEINVSTSNGIYFGDDVLIARGCYIRCGNHKFDQINIPINQQGHDSAILNHHGNQYSIVIDDDVWVGANVTILSGAHIEKGCVIAAGAVVTKKKYPPYSIIGGVPAKVIKQRSGHSFD